MMTLQTAGTCSFCGKDRRDVLGIAGVMGTAARICDECVGLCFDIMAEEREREKEKEEAARNPPPLRRRRRSRSGRGSLACSTRCWRPGPPGR
jgi:hypothetical protein